MPAVYGSAMRMTEDFHRHVPEARHRELHTEMNEAFATMAVAFERDAASEQTGLDAALAATPFFHLVLGLADIGQPICDRLARVARRTAAEKASLVARVFTSGYEGLRAAHERHLARVRPSTPPPPAPLPRRRPSDPRNT